MDWKAMGETARPKRERDGMEKLLRWFSFAARPLLLPSDPSLGSASLFRPPSRKFG